MNNSVANAAAFEERVRMLDTVLAACQNQGALADAELRDTSNRSGRDWPWWSVEISQTRAVEAEFHRLSATIEQSCTATLGVGTLTGYWRSEVWRDVAANRLDLTGSQCLTYDQLATPANFLATVAALLQQAGAALT